MNWSHLKYSLKGALKYLPLRVQDARRNRRHATADRRFLVIRHPAKSPFFYDVFLDWLADQFPDVRARFELQAMPVRVRDWSPYVLHVPWLQDPVQRWSPSAYQQANRLAAECDARNIPVINRVDRLTNTGKSAGARFIASVGLRTPKMVRVENHDEFCQTLLGLNLPVLVREDWGHGGLVCRADTWTQARAIPLGRFVRPVATEFIDVQSPQDGLYRKYRYLAIGKLGVPQSLHVCRGWMAKGTDTVYSEELREEELSYTSAPDPHHELFQAAVQMLGLEFLAFDYSYDRQGRPIVWEANPYPHLHFARVEHRYYRHVTVKRVFAAMVHLYFGRAGLSVPAGIEDLLSHESWHTSASMPSAKSA